MRGGVLGVEEKKSQTGSGSVCSNRYMGRLENNNTPRSGPGDALEVEAQGDG